MYAGPEANGFRTRIFLSPGRLLRPGQRGLARANGLSQIRAHLENARRSIHAFPR